MDMHIKTRETWRIGELTWRNLHPHGVVNGNISAIPLKHAFPSSPVLSPHCFTLVFPRPRGWPCRTSLRTSVPSLQGLRFTPCTTCPLALSVNTIQLSMLCCLANRQRATQRRSRDRHPRDEQDHRARSLPNAPAALTFSPRWATVISSRPWTAPASSISGAFVPSIATDLRWYHTVAKKSSTSQSRATSTRPHTPLALSASCCPVSLSVCHDALLRSLCVMMSSRARREVIFSYACHIMTSSRARRSRNPLALSLPMSWCSVS